jgi:DNA-binding HxlR family transcriptional regulator
VRGSTTGKPIMAALDLLGRRGALRIVWELRDGAVLTFRALQAAAELPPGTLNARLAELRAADVVVGRGGYRLTPRGAELIEALAPLLSGGPRLGPRCLTRGGAEDGQGAGAGRGVLQGGRSRRRARLVRPGAGVRGVIRLGRRRVQTHPKVGGRPTGRRSPPTPAISSRPRRRS